MTDDERRHPPAAEPSASSPGPAAGTADEPGAIGASPSTTGPSSSGTTPGAGAREPAAPRQHGGTPDSSAGGSTSAGSPGPGEEPSPAPAPGSLGPAMTTIGPDASAGRRPARQPRGGLGRHQEPSSTRGGNGFFRELPFLILVAFGLALLIKAFIVQAFYIPSGSMEQTLLIKDRVLVNKLVYRFRDIHRGEIVVFNGLDSFSPEVAVAPPGNDVQRILRGLSNAVGLGQPGEKDFIKRVIGVPGDTVACCDQSGRVTVNGVSLNEGYLYEDNMEPFGPVTVPPGRLWVMGDHRSMSADSRAHVSDPNQGTVPANKVIGRAFVRVWPFSRLGLLPVPDTFSQSFRSAARGGPTGQTGPAGRVPVPASVMVAATGPALVPAARRSERGRRRECFFG